MARMRAVWEWAAEAFWPLMLVGALAVFGLSYAVVSWAEGTPEEQAARVARRQDMAGEWARAHGLDATVTCFPHSKVCDVVPHDARPPFEIVCAERCSLWRSP